MKFSAIFSVRNVLRATGIVAILGGAPMLLAPACAASTFLTKKDEPKPKDDKALQIFVQSFGTAVVGYGLHALLAVPRTRSLAVSLATELTYFCTGLCNVLTDKYKDSGAEKKRLIPLISLNVLMILAQATSICCGDKPDEEEEEDSKKEE